MARSARLCKIEGCSRKHNAKGYCESHYARFRRGQALEGPIQRERRQRTRLCTIEGCNRKHYVHGFCDGHYDRFKHGRPMEGSFERSKFGIPGLDRSGYINVSINGVLKHKHVWMAIAALGKPLPKGAQV